MYTMPCEIKFLVCFKPVSAINPGLRHIKMQEEAGIRIILKIRKESQT